MLFCVVISGCSNSSETSSQSSNSTISSSQINTSYGESSEDDEASPNSDAAELVVQY